MTQPTEQDIQYLTENDTPENRSGFNQHFGEGAAETATGDDDGVVGVVDNTIDIVKGIPAGILDGLDNAGDTLTDAADAIGLPAGVMLMDAQGNFEPKFLSKDELADAGGDVILGDRDDPETGGVLNAVDDPTTTAGNLTKGISQFVIGMVGAGKFIKGTTVAKAAVKGAIVDFSMFDPEEARLSNLAEDWGYGNIVTDALKAEDDDTAWEGRLKNAAEGALLGGLVDGLIYGVKALKAGKAGKVDEAIAHTEAAEAATKDAFNNDGTLKPVEELTPPKERDVIDTTTPETADELAARVYKTDGVETSKVKLDTDAADEIARVADEIAATGKVPEGASSRVNLVRYLKNATDQRDLSAITLAISEVMAPALKKVDQSLALRHMKTRATNIVRELNFDGNPEVAIEAAIKRAGGVEHLQSEMMAAEMMELALTTAVKTTTDDINGSMFDAYGGTIKGAKEERRRLMRLSGEAFSAKMTILSGAGRTLRASQEGGVVRKALDSVRGTAEEATGKQLQGKDIKPLMTDDELDVLADAAAIEPSIIGKVFGKTYLAAANGVPAVVEYTLNSLLSGVKTHVANITGGLYRLHFDPIEMYGSGVPLLNGSLRGNAASRKEAFDTLIGSYKSMGHASKMAWHVLLKGENMLDPLQKVNESSVTNAIGTRNYDASSFNGKNAGELFVQSIREAHAEGIATSAKNIAGNIIRIPSRLLGAEDEFFKVAAYHGKVGALARKQALNESRKWAPEILNDARAFDKKLSEAIQMKVDDAVNARELAVGRMDKDTADVAGVGTQGGKHLDDSAIQYAEDITFTNRLEYGLGMHLQAFAQEAPLFKMIAPFIRTPTNIFRYSLQRFPVLGAFQKEMREALMSKDPAIRQQALAKQTISTMFWMGAYASVANGKITGGYPESKAERQNWKAAGIQPYSVITHNDDGTITTTSYQRAEPLSSTFGMVADLVHMSSRLDEHSKGEVAMAMTAAVVKNMSSKTYLKGLQDSIRFLQDMDGYGDSFVANRAAMLVPALLQQTNGDEYLREVHGVVEAMLAKTPWYERVDPQRNVLGSALKRPTAAWGPDAISPFAQSTWSSDPVRDELVRLEASIGLPRPKSGNVDLLSETLRVSDTQSMYDAWIERSGTIELSDATMKDALEDLIKGDEYRQAGTDPFDNGEVALPGTRVGMVRSLIKEFQDAALEELRGSHKELHQALIDDEVGAEMYEQSGRVPKFLLNVNK